MSDILVTGATGFVGRHVLGAFKDVSVRVISRRAISSRNVEIVLCDFEKDDIPACATQGIKTIYHLAGIAHSTGPRRPDPKTYIRVNVDATVNLAQLAVQSKVEKIIYLSSVKAIGDYRSGEVHSENRIDRELDTIYSETKRIAEERLIRLCRNSGVHLSIVRSPLVYGPGVKGNLRMMRKGIEGGWFPPIPHVKNRRSMIHVDDLVRALMFLDRTDIENCQIFNVTDEQEYSTREIYETMCLSVGKKVRQWGIPVFMFKILGHITPRLAQMFDKLLSDEYYESSKIKALGYEPVLTLRNINDSLFVVQHNPDDDKSL